MNAWQGSQMIGCLQVKTSHESSQTSCSSLPVVDLPLQLLCSSTIPLPPQCCSLSQPCVSASSSDHTTPTDRKTNISIWNKIWKTSMWSIAWSFTQLCKCKRILPLSNWILYRMKLLSRLSSQVLVEGFPLWHRASQQMETISAQAIHSNIPPAQNRSLSLHAFVGPHKKSGP